jgi:hypothetical protein
VKVNVHSEITLDHTIAKLRLQLKGHKQVSRGAEGRCLTHLKGQFDHRVTGGRHYPLASIPKKHRTKRKPFALKKVPCAEQGYTKGVEGEVKCLAELVELMIEEDAKHEYKETAGRAALVRPLKSTSEKHVSAAVSDAKQEQIEEQRVAAQQVDDPVLIDPLCRCQGQLMLDQVEIPGRRKFEMITHVITDVQHDYKRGGGYYEATCALVALDGDGIWQIPESEYITEGEDSILDPSLLSACYLVNLEDPENPIHYEDVRECMEARAAREAGRDPGGVVQSEIGSLRHECESESRN